MAGTIDGEYQVGKSTVALKDASAINIPPGNGFKEEFRAQLLAALAGIPVLKRFPFLRIVLLNWNKQGIKKVGYCSAEEHISNPAEPTVFLCLDVIIEDTVGRQVAARDWTAGASSIVAAPAEAVKSLSKELAWLLRHEMTHLLQFQTNRYAEKRKRWGALLGPLEARFQEWRRMHPKDITPEVFPDLMPVALAELRSGLTYLSEAAWTEGLAELFGKLPALDKDTLDTLAAHAAANAASVQLLWEALATVIDRLQKWRKAETPKDQAYWRKYAAPLLKELPRDIDSACKGLHGAAYDIGLHMVYTIWYAYRQQPDFIEGYMRWHRRDRFKVYIDCCRKLGLKPVFTFEGGSGMIDYGRMADDILRWAEGLGVTVPTVAEL